MGKVMFMRKGETHTIPKKGLPSGYTPLVYIQSSGTQYVDTGVSGGTNAAYEIKFNPLSLRVAYEMYFAGSKTATIPKLYGQTTGLTLEVGSTMVTQSDYLNADHVITVNADGTVLYDGTALTGFPSFAGVGWGDSTWWVCNAHEESTLQASMRLYGLKMWTNNILVRDLLPCINASGEVGLYDMVGKQFYGNAGTGVFTGSEVA